MRRKLKEKNIRKITKVGGTSYAVTLPIEFVKELGWRERQKVVVKKVGKRLIVSDWEPNKK
jgi:antitoxin component of MazEF toxin-antitoxin module